MLIQGGAATKPKRKMTQRLPEKSLNRMVPATRFELVTY